MTRRPFISWLAHFFKDNNFEKKRTRNCIRPSIEILEDRTVLSSTTTYFYVSVDDFATLKINGSLVASYDAAPQGNVFGSVDLPSGWYPFELIYKNRYGSTYLSFSSRTDLNDPWQLVPRNDLRSLDGSGSTVQGLRADYHTLTGTHLGTIYGEGPIQHGWSNLYEGVTAQWAGGLVDTNWGKFEERLTGEIFIGANKTDIIAKDFTIANGNVNFSYEIAGVDLPDDTPVNLYWSDDASFDSGDTPALTQPIQIAAGTAVGTYPDSRTLDQLTTQPTSATHLLLVVDPNNVITESDEPNPGDFGQNNVKSETLVKPDIAATSLTIDSSKANFSYIVTGATLPQDVPAFLYWASGPTESDILDLATTGPITIPQNTPLDTPITEQIAATDLLPAPSGATHLVVVVDPATQNSPNGLIDESDETNNVESVAIAIPDIAARSLSINDGIVSYSYEIKDADLPDDTSVGLYWSSDDTFDDGDSLAWSFPITGTDREVGVYNSSITVSDLLASWAQENSGDETPPNGTTHLLLVVDPNGDIDEMNESNNNSGFRAGWHVPVNRFSQAGWDAFDPYDHTSSTIQQKGCALTVLSMSLNSAGIGSYEVGGQIVPNNPGTLNKLLVEKGGYSGSSVWWGEATRQASIAAGQGSKFRFNSSAWGTSSDSTLANLIKTSNVPVAVGVNGNTHFVLVTGIVLDTFFIADPGFASRTTLDDYTTYEIRGYVEDPQDVSEFNVAVTAPGQGVNLTVLNSENHITGIDANGQRVGQIPQSSHFVDAIADDVSGEPSADTSQQVLIFQPTPGSYTIQITSEYATEYTLSVGTFASDGTDQGLLHFSSFIIPDVNITYKLTYSSDPASITEIKFDSIEVVPESDPLAFFEPQTGMFVIVGGDTDDQLRIQRDPQDYDRLVASINGKFIRTPKANPFVNDVQVLRIEAREGNDHINLAALKDFHGQVIIDAGEGNDRIIGSRGNDLIKAGPGKDVVIAGKGDDIIIGGDGKDLLFGGFGNDIIIGGRDRDGLFGSFSWDILIAGYTSFDDNNEALLAIQAEWTNPNHDYRTRIANIRGDDSNPDFENRINQHFFLTKRSEDATVMDDNVVDLLVGGLGREWFLFDQNRDRLFWRRQNELVN